MLFRSPILSVEDWRCVLKESGFKSIMSLRLTSENAQYGTGETVFIARNSEKANLINETEMLERLSDILPKYMIPEKIYEITKTPLSSNGKVDRKKLLSYIKKDSFDKVSIEEEMDTSMTELEKSIANIWKTVLNKSRLDKNMNFFQSGGDSLRAIKLVNALKEELGIEPKISWLFEAPTISKFAVRIQQEIDMGSYIDDVGEI